MIKLKSGLLTSKCRFIFRVVNSNFFDVQKLTID